MSGYVYFIAAETLGAVKIGFSGSHPSKRLRALQTGCPAPLKLLLFAPGTQADEAKLHDAFMPLHIHGEWFRNELKLRTLIYLMEPFDGGDPSRTQFEQALHDALLSCVEYDPLNPSLCMPEYVQSARSEPFGHFA